MGILIQNFAICVLLFTGNIISQYVNRRPWPTYSLHNMPQTSFTCQDKILGGYYADPETQCQMFHVCVKVAGVGVQDFRFLCPNGTAFDQEAQICADWGDVDCEQATLYYSSDNFDLYRLGSGFESKRAPLAEEEESTFHLQRAETNNIRRSKQTVVDQRSRPDNNGEYKETINNYNNRKSFVEPSFQIRKSTSYPNTFDENRKTSSQQISTTNTPSYIKSTIPAQITTKSYNYPQEEEILKGSHSSNFFNNRYNGKEEDLVDFNTEPPRSKPQTSLRTRQRGRNTQRRNQYNNNNILTSPSKVVTAITTESSRITPEQKSFTSDTKYKSQTLTLQTSFRTTDLNQYKNQEQVKTSPEITSTTQANFPYNLTPTKPQTQQNIQPTTYNPSNNGFKLKSTTSRYENFGETGKPISSQKSETNQNPFHNNQFEHKANEYNFENFNQPFNKKINAERTAVDINSSTPANSNNNLRSYNNGNDFSSNKEFQKLPTRGNERRRIDIYEKTQNIDKKQQNGERIRQEGKFNKAEEVRKPNAFGQTQKFVDNSNLSVRPLDPQKLNSAFHNQSDVNENQDRYNSNSFNRRITLTPDDSNYQKLSSESKNNKKYEQLPVRGVPSPFTNSPSQYSSRNTSPSPPFNDYIRQTSSLPLNQNTQQDVIPSELSTPRGFSRSTQFATKTTISTRKSQTNDYEKYQTVNRLNENYTPSSATKKFSTLVPKDQYYPTTFKPTTYKKQIDIFSTKVDKIQTKPSIVSYLPTTSTTSTTTQRSIAEPDEDDGQYHPELYEKDLPRSQFNVKPTKVQIPINQHSDFSDEDEFLKTAHSLNIAAGANQLRAEKAKQSSPNSLYKSSSLAPSKKPSTPSLPSKTSLKPKKPLANEDTSYDYAYYDTNGGNSHDYAEYDVISEFGKTKKQ